MGYQMIGLFLGACHSVSALSMQISVKHNLQFHTQTSIAEENHLPGQHVEAMSRQPKQSKTVEASWCSAW